jgi:spermidine/putrescine transport system substrate-binding protein
MRRRAFVFGAGAAACARRERPRLNVYNWSNYVAPGTVPNFEAEFGVRVRYGIYESNEEMLAKAMTGNSGWDVVFPSNYLIRPMVENGLLARLDHARLPNLVHLDRQFQAPPWDTELAWCVPYMWGASGIAFRRSVQPPPRAWADLWRAELGGRMTMLDDPAEVLGACLKKLGYSLNSTDPGELRRASGEAIAQKRLLRAYLNAEVRDQLVAGDVLAAQLWATTSEQASEASPEVEFVYPSEGFALYADNAAILRESRRPALAHRFLDYLLRPAVAQAIVKSTRTAAANAAAREPNAVLYPPEAVMARGEWFATMPAEAQRLRDRLWTEIKAA